MKFDREITITGNRIEIRRTPKNAPMNVSGKTRAYWIITDKFPKRFLRIHNIKLAISMYHMKSTYYIAAD